MTRSTFINQYALLAIIVCALLTKVSGQERIGGLAFYTLRDAMGSDVEATLKKVSAAGYSEGKFYGMEPTEFQNKMLNSKGLQPISTHQRVMDINETDAVISAVKEVGFKYFVVPSPPRSVVDLNRETRTMKMKGSLDNFANFLTELGKKCEKGAIQLLYHNHGMELKSKTSGLSFAKLQTQNMRTFK